MMWLCFFLRAVQWEDWAAADPDRTFSPSKHTPQNHILLFFIVATLFLVIGTVQYAIVGIKKLANLPADYQNFVDLCAVSNISCLIMDQEFHGYYIHGQAPWSSSDVPLSVLKREMDKEGMGGNLIRGLDQEHKDLQTFEIIFPKDIRRKYDQIMKENDQFDLQQKQIKKNLKEKEKKAVEEEKALLLKKIDQEMAEASPEEQEVLRIKAADVLKKVQN